MPLSAFTQGGASPMTQLAGIDRTKQIQNVADLFKGGVTGIQNMMVAPEVRATLADADQANIGQSASRLAQLLPHASKEQRDASNALLNTLVGERQFQFDTDKQAFAEQDALNQLGLNRERLGFDRENLAEKMRQFNLGHEFEKAVQEQSKKQFDQEMAQREKFKSYDIDQNLMDMYSREKIAAMNAQGTGKQNPIDKAIAESTGEYLTSLLGMNVHEGEKLLEDYMTEENWIEDVNLGRKTSQTFIDLQKRFLADPEVNPVEKILFRQMNPKQRAMSLGEKYNMPFTEANYFLRNFAPSWFGGSDWYFEQKEPKK